MKNNIGYQENNSREKNRRALGRPEIIKWPWRDYLTPKERKVIEASDMARDRWMAFHDIRKYIVAKSVGRARYHGLKKESDP